MEYLFGFFFLLNCFVLVLAFSNSYACKASQNQPGLGRPSTPVEDYLENQYIRAIFFNCLTMSNPFPNMTTTHQHTRANSHQDNRSFMENLVARLSSEPLMMNIPSYIRTLWDNSCLHPH